MARYMSDVFTDEQLRASTVQRQGREPDAQLGV
jgi:hypothetical protein